MERQLSALQLTRRAATQPGGAAGGRPRVGYCQGSGGGGPVLPRRLKSGGQVGARYVNVSRGSGGHGPGLRG